MGVELSESEFLRELSDELTGAGAAFGLEVFVRRYYDEHPDARRLDAEFVTALLVVAAKTGMTSGAVYRAVRVVEREVNMAGGAVGESGELQVLHTPVAYAPGTET